MHTTISPAMLEEYSIEERQARIDLAAAHRRAVRHGFN
jgi:hypothetical protein